MATNTSSAQLSRAELHRLCPCRRGGYPTSDLLRELADAAVPFAWVRPYAVDDDEVVHLTVTGAQMKRLLRALDH